MFNAVNHLEGVRVNLRFMTTETEIQSKSFATMRFSSSIDLA